MGGYGLLKVLNAGRDSRKITRVLSCLTDAGHSMSITAQTGVMADP